MLPFKQKTALSLYAAIVVLTATVFIADLYVPTGEAIWIIYFVPLVLSFLAWRPVIPVAVASVVTALLIIGRVAKPHEIDLEMIQSCL
jgi:hypothetical protein